VRRLRHAEIFAVGSELLTPFRSDTNSLYLTSRLNDLGITVHLKTIVGDERAEVAALLTPALARSDVIVFSGGLGPTADDVTREAVAEALHLPLDEDASVLAALRERFARRGMQMPEVNRRQASVPRGARLLRNPHGTAPGLWIDVDDRVVILLPGPPRELQALFETEVQPRLETRTGGARVWRRVLRITGRAESQVEEVAQPIYAALARGRVPIRTTILATPGQAELHLSAQGDDRAAAERALDDGVRRLSDALGIVVFSVDGRSLAEVVGDALRARGWRIAVAESCTGGLVLGRLTDVAGSSAWVVGGVMAYANEVKREALGVADALIVEHGAVSEPVALAMAEGVRARVGAEVGVGVTGIAGPSGGTPEKPVGTVAIALTGPSTTVRTFRFLGDRAMVRQQAVQAALDMVRRACLPS
jgi:nicotinamide-nucleotide amidase